MCVNLDDVRAYTLYYIVPFIVFIPLSKNGSKLQIKHVHTYIYI